MKKEIWKPVSGFDGIYEVSDIGRIRRVAPGKRTLAGRLLKPGKNNSGYRSVTLYKNRDKHFFSVHYLVAVTFNGPKPFGFDINHKDGDKENNASTNLEYVTKKQNIRHAINVLGRIIGTHTKLTTKQVVEIRDRKKRGDRSEDLAAEFGVSRGPITQIASGGRRRHV